MEPQKNVRIRLGSGHLILLVIIFIKSKRNLRLKRFKLKKGNIQLFSLLDNHQLNDRKKMKFCDHIVVNNKSLTILKKNLSNIIKLYE